MLQNSLCMEGLCLLCSWLSGCDASNFDKLKTNTGEYYSNRRMLCFNDHSAAMKLT